MAIGPGGTNTRLGRSPSAADQGYLVLYGDATEEPILQQAGIRRAAVLASVLSDDATNVFVTITARAMNRDLTIIARGEYPNTESKLLGCGANRVVLPTAIGATKVAQLIIRPTAENVLEQFTKRGGMNDELAQIAETGPLTTNYWCSFGRCRSTLSRTIDG